MTRWNRERWTQTGTNTAGDPVYARGAGKPTEPAAAPADEDYAEMTKDELQAILESRGLPKTGNKDELIERLGG